MDPCLPPFQKFTLRRPQWKIQICPPNPNCLVQRSTRQLKPVIRRICMETNHVEYKSLKKEPQHFTIQNILPMNWKHIANSLDAKFSFLKKLYLILKNFVNLITLQLSVRSWFQLYTYTKMGRSTHTACQPTITAELITQLFQGPTDKLLTTAEIVCILAMLRLTWTGVEGVPTIAW